MIRRISIILTLLLCLSITCICNANFFEDRNWLLLSSTQNEKIYSLPESCELSKTYPRTATILFGIYSIKGIPDPQTNTICHYMVMKTRYYENDPTRCTTLKATAYDINGDIIGFTPAYKDSTIAIENRKQIHEDFFGKGKPTK